MKARRTGRRKKAPPRYEFIREETRKPALFPPPKKLKSSIKNLLMFLPYCGHVEITEVTDAVWEKAAAPFTAQGPVGMPIYGFRHRRRIGRKTRAVYIEPLRYCICVKCMMGDVEFDTNLPTVAIDSFAEPEK